MQRTPSAARAIERAMSRRTPAAPKPAPDAWAREALAELDRQQRKREAAQRAEREAQRQAELAATPTPTMILRELGRAATRTSSAIPLNGAAVLRAALNGGSGTINGQT
jgi:hypothetical protein